MRTTNQKKIFREITLGFKSPFSSADILNQSAYQLSRATVFRLISQAIEDGKLKHVPSLGKESFYEVPKPHHHHQICQTCAGIEDLEFDCADQLHLSKRNQEIIILSICEQCKLKEYHYA